MFIIIIFILYYSVLGVFLQNSIIPNLFVALTVSLAIIFGFEKSLTWIIFAGFLMDIGSAWPVGSGILALVIVLWLIDKMKAITEFRSKRYLFVFLLFFTSGISNVVFDILMELIVRIEKIFLLNVSAVYSFPIFEKNYILKNSCTALSIIVVYFFARKISPKTEVLLARDKK